MENLKKICRLCLKECITNFTFIDDENRYIQNVGTIREMIQFCAPEMDFYVSSKPLICHQCLQTVVSVYNFKNKCLHVETVIRNYINRNNLLDYNFVNLNCVVLDEEKLRRQLMENKDNVSTDSTLNAIAANSSESTMQAVENVAAQSSLVSALCEEVKPEFVNPICDLEDSSCIEMENTSLSTNIEEEEYTESDNIENSDDTQIKNDPYSLPSSTVSEGQIFKCTPCKFITHDMKSITMHYNMYHKNVFLCPSCPLVTSKMDQLTKHMVTAHRSNGKVHSPLLSCDSCTFKTNSSDTLRQHVKTAHMKARDLLLPCKQCPYKAISMFLLSKHVESKHREQHIFTCGHCPYASKDKSNFKKHVFTHSTKPMQCMHCEYKCVSPYQMRRHVKKKHGTADLNNYKLSVDYFSKVNNELDLTGDSSEVLQCVIRNEVLYLSKICVIIAMFLTSKRNRLLLSYILHFSRNNNKYSSKMDDYSTRKITKLPLFVFKSYNKL